GIFAGIDTPEPNRNEMLQNVSILLSFLDDEDDITWQFRPLKHARPFCVTSPRRPPHNPVCDSVSWNVFMLSLQDSTPSTQTRHHDTSALPLNSLHAGNRLRTR